MLVEQRHDIGASAIEATIEKPVSGRIIGFMGPLMRLYRICSTPVSLERQRAIAGVVNDAKRIYPSLAVLVVGSLAYGMSVEDSDIDLGITTTRKDVAASDLVLKNLGGQLPPGVKVKLETKIHPGDITTIRGDLALLRKYPLITEAGAILLHGHSLVVTRDFFVQLSTSGLLFGFPVDRIQRKLDKEYSNFATLKTMVKGHKTWAVWYHFEWEKPHYEDRLLSSPAFITLGKRRQKTFLAKIAAEEERLKAFLKQSNE